MRDLNAIGIASEMWNDNTPPMRVKDIVEKMILDLSNCIMKEDAKIIKRCPPGHDLEQYVNVEMYIALYDYINQITDEEQDDHEPNNCPVCRKINNAKYLIRCLIHRWKLSGTSDTYREIIEFRINALEAGRVIN